MSCVKCGKKVEEGNVFCPECLEDMKQYPVKPGTPVHIPTRPEPAERKPARPRKERTPEEQIASLHKLVQWLVILVVALATTLVVSLGVLVYVVTDAPEAQPAEEPGRRNYTTAATTDAP